MLEHVSASGPKNPDRIAATPPLLMRLSFRQEIGFIARLDAATRSPPSDGIAASGYVTAANRIKVVSDACEMALSDKAYRRYKLYRHIIGFPALTFVSVKTIASERCCRSRNVNEFKATVLYCL
jgi:hypothetical protein